MNKINKDELTKLKKEMESTIEPIIKKAKIIYDGKQYSVRIPAKIAKTMNINTDTDKIKFTVTISSKFNENPKLMVELIQNGTE